MATWEELDQSWRTFLQSQRWDTLSWLADNLRQPQERLEQHRVLQEMGKRYAESVGFPSAIWPGTESGR